MDIFNKRFKAAKIIIILLNKFREGVILLKIIINDYYNIINLEILDSLENSIKKYFFNVIKIVKEPLIVANFYLFNNYLIINGFRLCAF